MYHLTEKYFEDQCSEEALDQLLTWFQTTEGQAFLSKQIEEDCNQLVENDHLSSDGKIPTELIFNRIQKSKENPSRTHWILMWLMTVLLLEILSVHYSNTAGMLNGVI